MILAVDIGNSSSKTALYSDNKRGNITRIEGAPYDKIAELINENNVKAVIISDVSVPGPLKDQFLKSTSTPVHYLNPEMKFPFTIAYKTMESIGSDRLAAIAGAMVHHPATDVLVIDAGSAVTYDFITSGASYEGGNISPGLSMRFRALNNFTGRLPLVSAADSFREMGDDTTGAIRSGVILGLIYEINSYIRTFKSKYKGLKVVLSGGDAGFLSDHIDFSFTFAPDLVLDGLYNIMIYNA